MVRRADLQNVSGITRAGGATAPSKSASALQITYLPPGRLHPSPTNARTHSKKQLKQIVRSIERFGFVNPVLISDDFEIVAGHGRVEAAKMLGLREIPTVRLSKLSPADRRAYVIADNRLAELAGWDRDLLATELQGLLELQFDDIELTGFSLGEIDLMLDKAVEKKAEKPGREDELPANSLSGPAVSRAGDLWVLGPHRLLCGDARNLTSYQLLLEAKQADLVLTDPRFNVAVEGCVALDRVGDGNIATASAEMSEDQFIAFLTAFLQRTKENTKDGAILVVFMDWRHLYELITASREVGLAHTDIVVWAKGGAAGAAKGSFYRCRHQLVLVFKNGDPVQTNTREPGQHGRRRTNIWDYAAVGSLPARTDLALHPLAKPTALVADAIRDVTGRGAIVLDPFAGTGTTIIAAEKTGRLGRAIERDPLYCDVIIRRWQQYTGKAARLAGSDQTFAEVEAVRLLGQSVSTAKRSGGH